MHLWVVPKHYTERKLSPLQSRRGETVKKMKAIISVTGCDSMGIIAKVSLACAEYGVNIIDISQTVLQEYFVMIMIVDIDRINAPFNTFVDKMTDLGKSTGLEIHTMHEDIFNSMHKI